MKFRSTLSLTLLTLGALSYGCDDSDPSDLKPVLPFDAGASLEPRVIATRMLEAPLYLNPAVASTRVELEVMFASQSELYAPEVLWPLGYNALNQFAEIPTGPYGPRTLSGGLIRFVSENTPPASAGVSQACTTAIARVADLHEVYTVERVWPAAVHSEVTRYLADGKTVEAVYIATLICDLAPEAVVAACTQSGVEETAPYATTELVVPTSLGDFVVSPRGDTSGLIDTNLVQPGVTCFNAPVLMPEAFELKDSPRPTDAACMSLGRFDRFEDTWDTRSDYHYDAAGRVSYIDEFHLDSNASWLHVTRYVYTRGPSGHVLEVQGVSVDDTRLLSVKTFDYDENEVLVGYTVEQLYAFGPVDVDDCRIVREREMPTVEWNVECDTTGLRHFSFDPADGRLTVHAGMTDSSLDLTLRTTGDFPGIDRFVTEDVGVYANSFRILDSSQLVPWQSTAVVSPGPDYRTECWSEAP